MRTTLVVLAITALILAGCAAASTLSTDLEKPGEPVPAALPTGGPLDFRSSDAGGEAIPDQTDRLIVRIGEVELQVTDVPAAYRQARQLALRLGGYVGDSAFATDDEGRPTATVVLRIPADRYDEALEVLRPLAVKVVLERSQESDVTSQVVDLDARIGNLRASEAALVKLFDRAGKISEILEVQRELTSTREQIEQLVAQRDLLAKQAALATLTVTLSPVPEPVSAAAKSWDPGAEVERAFAALIDVAQTVAGVAIWLGIVVLPVVVVGLVVLAVALRVGRRLGLDLRPRRAAAGPPTDTSA